MGLKDRISTALRAVREYPVLLAEFGVAEYEQKQLKWALEQKTQECEHLQGMTEAVGHRLRFAECRASALSEALQESAPKLSTAEEMKRFYKVISPSLDAGGYTLHRMSEKISETTAFGTEEQLYRAILERMGFGGLLAPEHKIQQEQEVSTQWTMEMHA